MSEAAGAQKIIVGVDGSSGSLAALRWAAGEAVLRDAEVVVVHVWSSSLDRLPPYVSRSAIPSFEEEQDRAAAGLAAVIHEVFPPNSVVRVRPVLAYGLPARVLIEHAMNADLLVLGGHRSESPLKNTVGAVAAACLRRSPCPLVIVAPEPTADPELPDPGERRAAMAVC